MPRTLVVIRHAKAQQYAESDRARPLTDRGRADAAAAGRHLAALGLVPDHALVSAARRTVETWEQVRAATGGDPVEDVAESVYQSTPGSVLESLRLVGDERRVVVVVGHNPCMEELVHLLDDQQGDPVALTASLSGMPTAAVALLEVPGSWAELDEGTARLVGFHVARG